MLQPGIAKWKWPYYLAIELFASFLLSTSLPRSAKEREWMVALKKKLP